jgi:hypothetical protein
MSRALVWLFCATLSLILLLQLRGIDAPLAAVTPGGIVAYELAFTVERAREILAVWRSAGVTEQARVSLGVDVGFLLVYPWFFWHTVRLLRRPGFSTPGTAFDRVGHVLGVAVMACMPLDALENWLLWRMLETGASSSGAALAGGAAALKFLLVLLTTLWCLAALSRRLTRSSSSPSHG